MRGSALTAAQSAHAGRRWSSLSGFGAYNLLPPLLPLLAPSHTALACDCLADWNSVQLCMCVRVCVRVCVCGQPSLRSAASLAATGRNLAAGGLRSLDVGPGGSYVRRRRR